jgi:cell division protein FtsZ
MIHFDLPKDRSSILKVIGVGGGGSNAINYMHSLNIEGVDFIVCNTDAQALALSNVPNKVHLGPALTQGLGAGANPEIGRKATEESLEELRRLLEVNTKMVFITVGMGGGTGTGGAPVISKICKDLGILTVGIVTTPFEFEGPKRLAQAVEGIDQLRQYVDTMLVISNDKLRHQFGNLRMSQAFAKADNVLATAAKCITDVINTTGSINTDFADVKTVMQNGGVAILGNAVEIGENRAQLAIENALNSPLLNDNDISGAKWILLNINSGEGDYEFTMDEINLISSYLRLQSGADANVILGTGTDASLGEALSVTIIATGFNAKDPFIKEEAPVEVVEEEKVFVTLHDSPNEATPYDMENALANGLVNTENASAETTQLQLTETFSTVPETTPWQVVQEQVATTIDVNNSTTQQASIHFDFEEAMTMVVKQQPTNNEPVVNDTDITLTYKEDRATEIANRINNFITPTPPTTVYNDESTEPVQDLATPATTFSFDNEPSKLQEKVSEVIPQEEELSEEEIRKRIEAQERATRLRNLSFNSSELNEEYDNVPAYMRRNIDLSKNNSAENFYSKTSITVDENNNTQISTLNNFLDGKKPD